MVDLEPEYRVDGSCWKFVTAISDGYFNNRAGDRILRHPLILLQMQLAIIFTLTTLIHLFLRRYYLPRLISEVLTGLILGPSLIERFLPKIKEALFPRESLNILGTLTRFGYLFFMFLIGVRMDINLIKKSGKREWIIGSLVITVPLIVITNTAQHIGETLDKMDPESVELVRIFSGTVMLTSFPVVAVLLMHLKIINTELGHVVLSSALISDLLSVVIINIDYYFRLYEWASILVANKALLLCIALIVFIETILSKLFYWIIRRTPEGKPVKDAYLFFVIIALLIVAIVGDNVGLQYMYGPFILGLTVPTGPPLASGLIEKLDTIVTGLMLPLMSTYCGYTSNLWELNKKPPVYVIYIITCGFFVKIISGFIPAICLGLPCKDAIALALMLSAKGIIELGTFATNAERQAIGPQLFTFAVLVVFFSAALVPTVIRKLHDPSKTYAGYQKRTILNSPPNEELRLLACAHKQDDAMSAIKLLELANPATESPLFVFGLYLEELVGGSSPVLLNHQLKQKSSSEGSRWQPIIDVFKYFKLQSRNQSQVHVFTAISPPKLMHEDICWVAFKNSVALIILPFHKKWNSKGKLVLNSKDLRTLNSNVLNKAPCSVGILIDRSRTSGPSIISRSVIYHVCVIYLGGKDDREALSFARRMRGWTSVYLTIIRLLPLEDDGLNQEWEDMLDNECLRDLKHPSEENNGNVIYKEEAVRDGRETALVVGAILEENFDMILVGRHSQSNSPLLDGLSEWTDLPELGPIGDLLASSEINNPISIFVVQQQITQKE